MEMQIILNTKVSLKANGEYHYEDVIYTFHQAGKFRNWYCMYKSPKTHDTVVREYKSEASAKAAQKKTLKQGGVVRYQY